MRDELLLSHPFIMACLPVSCFQQNPFITSEYLVQVRLLTHEQEKTTFYIQLFCPLVNPRFDYLSSPPACPTYPTPLSQGTAIVHGYYFRHWTVVVEKSDNQLIAIDIFSRLSPCFHLSLTPVSPLFPDYSPHVLLSSYLHKLCPSNQNNKQIFSLYTMSFLFVYSHLLFLVAHYPIRGFLCYPDMMICDDRHQRKHIQLIRNSIVYFEAGSTVISE